MRCMCGPYWFAKLTKKGRIAMSDADKLNIGGLMKDILQEEFQKVSKEDNQGYSDNPWSLDRVADLLWRHSWRSRPVILGRVIREFEDALDHDRMPSPILLDLLLHDYWDKALRPLLVSVDQTDEARSELKVIQEIVRITADLNETYLSHNIREVILSKLSHEPYISRVQELDPEWWSVISRRSGQ